MSNIIKTIKAKKFSFNKTEDIDEEVIEDTYLNIYINNKNIQNLLTINEDLDFLSYGTLFLGTELDKEIILKETLIVNNNCYLSYSNTFYNLCCCMQKIKNKTKKSLIEYEEIEIKPEIIFKIYKIFNEQSKIFKKTAGIHSASIFDINGNLIYFSQDIARHNCISKIAGFLLKNPEKITLTKYIFLSCRVNSEIVNMISDIGFSIILTKSAVSYNGIKKAISNNIKLIGFIREDRFTYFYTDKNIN